MSYTRIYKRDVTSPFADNGWVTVAHMPNFHGTRVDPIDGRIVRDLESRYRSFTKGASASEFYVSTETHVYKVFGGPNDFYGGNFPIATLLPFRIMGNRQEAFKLYAGKEGFKGYSVPLCWNQRLMRFRIFLLMKANSTSLIPTA